MSGWSNEETLLFLQYYENEPCIWNPKDLDHKNKKKVIDAWCRLSKKMRKPVNELKSKKELMMATFRKHLKKKRDSMQYGADTGDYNPVWYAYDQMESFLLPVYNSDTTTKTETGSHENEDHEESHVTEHVYLQMDDHDADGVPSGTSCTRRFRRRVIPDTPEKRMARAFEQLTNALNQRRNEVRTNTEEDECDLYGKLLAKRLRQLTNNERKLIMYQIDGLFINKMINRAVYHSQ